MHAVLERRIEVLARQIGPEWETLASELNVTIPKTAHACNGTYHLALRALVLWQKKKKPLHQLVNALRASGRLDLVKVVERWQKPRPSTKGRGNREYWVDDEWRVGARASFDEDQRAAFEDA